MTPARFSARAARPTADLVPLADRVRWALFFRIAVIGLPVLLWLVDAADRTSPLASLAIPAAAYAALAALTSPRARWRRGVTLWVFTTALLADGVYLGWAWHCLNSLAGPVGYVVIVHVVAVTLLASFRTGLKLAMWHSLVGLSMLNAEVAHLVEGGTATAFPTVGFSLYIGAIWAGSLVTATFAAVNERELRRRRYDGEVLRRFGLELENVTDPVRILLLLGRLAHEELLAPRVVVMSVAQEGVATVVQVREGAKAQVGHLPDGLAPGALFDRAVARRGPVLAAGLRAEDDPWLAALWPGCRNLVAVPFTLDGQTTGALIFETARRGVLGNATIERRAVSTAEQATGHAAMALGRAMLLGRLRAAADTDGLTGVANRRTFDRSLEDAVRSAIASGHGFAVALIDLDHFKKLNDSFGHQVGDDVLRAAAAAISGTCREQDTAARYGGEEFGVILRDIDPADARAAGERIRSAIADCSSPVPVTASVGVATFPEAGGDVRTILAAADRALYAAKAAGRNSVSTAWDEPPATRPSVAKD